MKAKNFWILFGFICLVIAMAVPVALIAWAVLYETSRLNHYFEGLTIVLVVLLLIVPICWLFLFHGEFVRETRALEESPGAASERRRRLLHWITAFSVPWLVLGLAMVVEIDSLREANGNKGAASIAAIMILYALTLLASFLYVDLQRLRLDFLEKMEDSSNFLKTVNRFHEGTHGSLPPHRSILNLIQAWSKWYERFFNPEDQSASLDKADIELRQSFAASFLRVYAEEERIDIRGEVPQELVPASVQLSGEDEIQVSYFATNVGLYAKYLADCLGSLNSRLLVDRVACVAAVTNVVPNMWWYWPFDRSGGEIRARPHASIVRYRKTLRDIVRDRNIPVRIYRQILLAEELDELSKYRDSDDFRSPSFYRDLISLDQYNEVKEDLFVMKKEEIRDFPSLAKTIHNKEWVSKWLRWAEFQKLKAPVCLHRDASPHLPETLRENHVLKRLLDIYKDDMHRDSCGCSHITAVSPDLFLRKFQLDSCEDVGFNGCTDIMFLGSQKVDDSECLWTGDETPRWSLALLATMSPASETMFLTIVTSTNTIDSLWTCVSSAVGKLNDPEWKSCHHTSNHD